MQPMAQMHRFRYSKEWKNSVRSWNISMPQHGLTCQAKTYKHQVKHSQWMVAQQILRDWKQIDVNYHTISTDDEHIQNNCCDFFFMRSLFKACIITNLEQGFMSYLFQTLDGLQQDFHRKNQNPNPQLKMKATLVQPL